ncbi:MAG: 3-isopropylmalate dehydratase small subunit [Chloroflexota bacterium]|nr:3-isopropylmalate dehydratase small subunit [Chloroflexota bacterium]
MGEARGKAWKVGDDIPTDYIVPEWMVFKSFEEMAKHTLEIANPEFSRNVQPGDILVAGRHFGCSSGRAVAVKALAATKIGAVVADSFSRTFYRNAFEIALPIVEIPGISKSISQGDTVRVDVRSGRIVNETTGQAFEAGPPPPFLLEMLEAGGIIPLADRLAAGELASLK